MLWLTGPFIKTVLLILKAVLYRKISGGIYSALWSLSLLLRKPLRNSFNIYKLRCFIKASTLGPCRLLQACNHQSTLTGPFIKTFLLILKTVLCRKISGGGIYSTFWSLSPLLRKPLRNSFNIYKLRCFIKASTLGPCRLLQACNHQSTSDRISLKNNSFLSFSLPLTVLYCFLFF